MRSFLRYAGAVLALALPLAAGACSDDPVPPGEPRADRASSSAPTAESSAEPPPPPEPPPTITLTLVGDIMLVRGVPDPGAALAPLRERLAGADITVGNLESTLSTNGAPTQGDDSFGGSPGLLVPLQRAGFDALSLANNHAGDYGSVALVDTVRAFSRSRIKGFGAGENLAEASEPAVIERDGVRFAFVGFNAIGETARAAPGQPGALSVRMPPRTGPLVPADLDHVVSVVRRAKQEAEVVIVLPHWGTQYTHDPEPIQRFVARRLVAAGADLVVGGHPHWVQSAERVRGVAVFHSLGNFVFDMDFMTQTMQGVFLETTWEGDRLVEVQPVPYRMDPVSFAPRVARGAAGTAILEPLRLGEAAP